MAGEATQGSMPEGHRDAGVLFIFMHRVFRSHVGGGDLRSSINSF